MKTKFYLKVNSNGSVNTTKSRPDLRFDEVAILVNVELPDLLFQKPQITATIAVSDENITPFTIDAITVDNVKDAIETATGIQVKLSIEQPEN
ncbi:MAG: hypothetical protein ABIN91_11135 [Mucilaginibacter sp.]|uniref:hypothetical protein n=1 Tax=Mucilaginibacter sp. TaxID=1882438 RepID=UPI003262D477